MTGKKFIELMKLIILMNILGVSSIINACDLIIINCSNVNAHISGALGKKLFFYCH